MRIWVTLLVAVLVLGLTSTVEAKGHKSHAAKGSHLSGKVVSVSADGKSVVIKQSKKHGGQEVTVQTDTSTTVKIDSVAGKQVTDLTPGMHVRVSPATGTAQKIKVCTKHHHKHKNA